jgi:HK97 gp10 family phage protein
MEIEIEGLRELRANLEKAARTTQQGAMKGLQEVGLEIVAEAKLNLQRNGTNNRRTLSNSGKVQKDKDGVDVGFFGKGSKGGYAAAVEYGRGPTEKPSEDGITLRTSLRDWVHRKLGIPKGKELETATFLIARKIHKEGTKPQPFFTPAVEKFQDKISDIVSKTVGEALK